MRRITAFFAVAFVVLSSPHVAFGQKGLSSDERKDVHKLLGDFTKAKTMAELDAIITKVLGHGAPAARLLEAKVGTILASNQKRYLAEYQKAAKQLIKRPNSKNTEDVRKLRKTLEELRDKGKKLTKDDVVATGDPALKRLLELQFLEHADVLKGHSNLARLREQLLTVGTWQERCIASIKSDNSTKASANDTMIEPAPYPVTLTRLEMLVRAQLTVGKKHGGVLKSNETLSSKIRGSEALGILHLNVMRMALGLKPLKVETSLCAAARDHSNDMRTKNFFSHTSPVPGKSNFTDRARRFRASASGENIAMGSTDSVKTNMQWWHSPGHHLNMMAEKYKGIGLGCSGKYWTQLFK